MSFYRDARKREIDLVIQDGRTLHPVEIKVGMTVRGDAVRNFSCLDDIPGYEVGLGHVICQTEEPYFISRDVQAVPVWPSRWQATSPDMHGACRRGQFIIALKG